jgi:PAS domain S-box-containing protein
MGQQVGTKRLVRPVLFGMAVTAMFSSASAVLFHSVIPAAAAVPVAFVGAMWVSNDPENGEVLFVRSPDTHVRKLQSIAELHPDPAFAVDSSGKIVAWNHALENLTWVRAEDAVGEDRAQLSLAQLGTLMPDLVEAEAKPVPGTRGDKAEPQVKDIVIRIDCNGDERIYVVRSSKIFEADGMPIGVIETFTDITGYYGMARRTEYLESLHQAIMDLAPNGIHVVDEQWRTFGCNDKFLQTWGLSSNDASYKWYPWLQVSEDFLSRTSEPVQYFHAISDIYSFPREQSYHIVDMKDGRKVEQRSVPVVIGDRIAGRIWSYTALDCIPATPPAMDKNALIKELHHRVKNNLQIISSIQSLQSKGIEDRLSKKMFRRCQDRIKSMALIYEYVHVSGYGTSVDFNDYLRMLALHLFSSYNVRTGRVELKMNVPPIDLCIDSATPCGLIVGELITNSLQYAFPGEMQGEISVIACRTGDLVTVAVSDNGIGFPRNINYRDASSLGLQIINSLTEQLGGSIHMYSETGTRFEITFHEPIKNQ